MMFDWRQGDYTLTPIDLPLLAMEEGEASVIFTSPPGVAVLTQSCDVVRSAIDKPYIQIAALSPAKPSEMAMIKAGQILRYGYLAPLEDHGLVVDFDVAATVDKETAQHWQREQGCRTDAEQRDFAKALARHRQRFAFPDEFNDVVKPVRRWLEGKRSADSPYGRFVRAIREIRVICDNWDAPTTLRFLLLIDENVPDGEQKDWDKAVETLQGKASPKATVRPSFALLRYDDLSARDYVISDRLDLDGLSDA